MLKRWRLFSIRQQLTFLIVSIINIALLLVFSFGLYIIETNIKESELKNLYAISDREVDFVYSFLNEREGDIQTLSRNPILYRIFSENKIQYDQRYLDEYITYYLKIYKYRDLYLLDTKGNIIYTASKINPTLNQNVNAGELKDTELSYVYNLSATILEQSVSNFSYFKANNNFSAFISSPIFIDNTLLGVVVLEVSDVIFAEIQKYSGLGKSGEILVTTHRKEKIEVISKFRNPNDSLILNSLKNITDVSIIEASTGINGSGEILDFRDKPVYAVWKYLPAYNWGLIVKIDKEEALGDLNALKNVQFGIAIFSIFIGILLSISVARYFANPINRLSDLSEKLALGDFTSNGFIAGNNQETTSLINSFFWMKEKLINTIKSLKETSEELQIANTTLEERVQDRTSKLNAILSEIQRDLRTAQKIQTQLIPIELNQIGNLSISSHYIPLDLVGGDLFDISQLASGAIRIFLADATGHGVQAAMITMLIKSEIETLKDTSATPAAFLKNLDSIFIEKYNSAVIFSAFVMDILPSDNTCVIASAGHPSQYVLRGTDLLTLQARGGLIGVSVGQAKNYENMSFSLNTGDKLIIFSDGLIEEIKNEKIFDEENVMHFLLENHNKDINTLTNTLLDSLKEFVEHDPYCDDVTLIGIEVLEKVET